MCSVQVKAHELLPVEDEVDAGAEAALLLPTSSPPKMTVCVETSDVMQVTVSKTALDVFKSLGQVTVPAPVSSLGYFNVCDAGYVV